MSIKGYHLRIVPRPCPGGYGLVEFESGDKRLDKSTYPTKSPKGYYQPGDVILIADLSFSEMEMLMPELKALFPDWIKYLMNSIGEKRASGYQILDVIPLGDSGRGSVPAQRVLFFDKVVVQMDEIQIYKAGHVIGNYPWVYTRAEDPNLPFVQDRHLRESFISKRQFSASSKTMGFVGPIIASMATGALSGAGKAAGKAVVKKGVTVLTRRQFARRMGKVFILQWLRKDAVKFMLKGSLAFVKAAATQLVLTDAENRLRKAANRTRSRAPGSQDVNVLKPSDITNTVLVAGATAFMNTVLDEAAGGISNVLKTQMPDSQYSLKGWITKTFCDVFIQTFSVEATRVLVDSFNGAYQKYVSSGRQPRSFSKLVGEEMAKNMTAPLSKAVDKFTSAPGGLADQL